jgi:hypothetical protein
LAGSTRFYGSLGGVHLDASIVGITNSFGSGYWLIGADGGIFSFGNAPFTGSFVNSRAALGSRAIGILVEEPPAAAGGGIGLCLVAANGNVLCQPVIPF